ncbi:hypothetical protein GCM10027079_26770 [Sediminivirga luteola]|uniref:DUF4040 domain-containing protein n=2 Tax=Sediminivirga luteola TaxID=1774748 RepID=A0A8J2XLQ0_9MICO|nr:hypothetical protein GCM10011333_29530 [Sediminivirga luteola]
MPLLDLILAGTVLVTAVLAVLAPRRDAAASAFLIFGVLLALLWARLEAPDIALAEAALGGGVAGALLVDALHSRRPPQPQAASSWAARITGAAAGAALLAALLIGVRAVPQARAPLAEEAYARIPVSGVEHPVTAVLLNYRSYDTLLEIAVLAVAALGAAALAQGHRPVVRSRPAVRGLALVLLPVLLLLAAWLLVAGTSQPGGAFQAGALLGAALVIAHLAGIGLARPQGLAGLAWTLAGLLSFLALAAGTAVFGAGWLVLDPAWAPGAILAIEAILAVSIGAGLALIFLSNSASLQQNGPAGEPGRAAEAEPPAGAPS